MPKYRMMVSWPFAGATDDYGIEEFDSEEDAAQAAFDMACERISAWAEPVTDDEDEDE